MNVMLVAGAVNFLGYHVVKRLNQAGIRPRVLELRESRLEVLDKLDVERCAGHLEDPAALRAACAGVDTLLHLAFKVNLGGGAPVLEQMRETNVAGTRRLLTTAADAGVRRAVVTGSALAVGVNKSPVPLDESADWSKHAFDLPYAQMRRQAELEAIALANSRFDVMTVCPAFTFGPDDPSGAPANKLLQAVVDGKLPFTLRVGFGCLDVRDFANGMVLAAERGRSGQRYLLSGENVTTNQLLEQAARIAGTRPPRFTAPAPLVRGIVGILELLATIRRKPAPITGDVLQILGRYAWYDTSKARQELGWAPRPLRETLDDTIRWLKDPVGGAAAPPVTAPGAASR
jgi:dihydroflavonol-4-reductase